MLLLRFCAAQTDRRNMASSVDVVCGILSLLFIGARSVFCNNITEWISSSLATEISEPTVEPSRHDSSHLNGSIAESFEDEFDNSGQIAGIVIGVLTGIVIIAAALLVVLYRYFRKRNLPSLNFDNPVYRKTTEDQFSLEKNQYHPAHSYPSSLEPLTSPGTNEFV